MLADELLNMFVPHTLKVSYQVLAKTQMFMKMVKSMDSVHDMATLVGYIVKHHRYISSFHLFELFIV